MKQKIYLLFVLIFISNLSYSQIKVFPNNKISFGTTVSPANFGIDNLFIGNKIAFADTATAIASSALIRGSNSFSSKTNPDFTWYNNDHTGFFHPNLGIIGISINGTERCRIDNSSFKVNGPFKINDWTDVIIDYSHGTCCDQPTMYPENNWYLKLGTPTKKLGDIYATNIRCNWVYESNPLQSKSKVNQIENSINKLKLVTGVTYKVDAGVFDGLPDEIIQEYTMKNQFGFVASDLEKIYPELVYTEKETGEKSISYTRMVPILLEAIKAQQTQIENLTNIINNCCKVEGGNKSINTNSTNIEETYSVTETSKLFQNTPNPFSRKTVIRYMLDKNSSNATILIFNMQGTLIKTYNNLGLGNGQITINSGELKAGMYLYSLIAGDKEIDTKRMILTK